MKKNNMRTPEEKEQIVKRYLDGETAVSLTRKFNLPNKLIYRWINKHMEFGIEGLKSNTGKSKGGNKGVGAKKPKNKIEELELEIMKKDIEIARLKKRLYGERSWCRKGIRYYIQQEYKIVDDYKDKYSIKTLCEYMSIVDLDTINGNTDKNIQL